MTQIVTNNGPIVKGAHWTEFLLAQLRETCRQAIGTKLVVGVAFIDFHKAFDCVPHTTLIQKLQHNFGINGGLLAWLKDYLKDRQQFTAINEKHSHYAKVTYGIPQGSVLGPHYSHYLRTGCPPQSPRERYTCRYTSADEVFSLLFFYWHKVTKSPPSPNRAQITIKSPRRHKKDSQAGKWTLLLHLSAYSGHCIISPYILLISFRLPLFTVHNHIKVGGTT